MKDYNSVTLQLVNCMFSLSWQSAGRQKSMVTGSPSSSCNKHKLYLHFSYTRNSMSDRSLLLLSGVPCITEGGGGGQLG
jgi:hypothetical protein